MNISSVTFVVITLRFLHTISQLSQRDITDICGGLDTEDRVFGGHTLRTSHAHSLVVENTFDWYTIDFTPAEYITLLFTDLGAMTPAAVSDELIKLYQ